MTSIYGLTEQEYQNIECELTSLCLRGISLDEDSPDHEEIQKAITEWHKKYDHIFDGKNE